MMKLLGFTDKHIVISSLSPNLIALIFISAADLSQDQRQSLTSIMTHRNRTMDQYRVNELRETFIEMFCTVKTAVDNPMMNPSGSGEEEHFSARRRRPRWQLWLLGRRRGRWSWRIPGCLRRCTLDLGWQWLLMVSKKISRKKNKERKRKKRKRKRKEKRKKSSCWRWKLLDKWRMARIWELKIGMKAFGPMKMRQHANPKAGMNGKSMDEYGFFKRKRKERSWTSRSRKRTRWWERRSKLCEPITFFSTRNAASSSTFVSECLWFLCDTFTCVLDISQGGRKMESRVWSLIFQCLHSWNRTKAFTRRIKCHQLWQS